MFKISIHDQLLRRDLLHHHAQLELGDIADGNRLRAPLAQVAGNFHHGIIRHLRDAALVFHDDQIAVRIVIGNGTCHIHNKIAKSIEQVQVCFLLAAALADQLCLLDHVLLTAIHDHVGTRVVGIHILGAFLGIQIVLQVGIGQILREVGEDLLKVLPCVTPGRIGVVLIMRSSQTELHDLFLQFRHTVHTALVVQVGPPAKVVQTKVDRVHIVVFFQTQHLCEGQHDCYRHIADVQDLIVVVLAAGGLSHDRSRVGVIDDPCLRCVLAHIVDHLEHAGDGTQAVCHAAGAAGLLTHNAKLQRDLLVLLPHFHAALTDLSKGKVNIGIGLFRVRGGEVDALRIQLCDQRAAQGIDQLQTIRVNIVQHQLFQREAVKICNQALDNAGGMAGAAADNNNFKSFHF